VSRDLPQAHQRLLGSLTRRWIKGTGFVHGSVVRDLIERELVEHRVVHGARQIRARAAHLTAGATHDR
jgi:hypothetical protein